MRGRPAVVAQPRAMRTARSRSHRSRRSAPRQCRPGSWPPSSCAKRPPRGTLPRCRPSSSRREPRVPRVVPAPDPIQRPRCHRRTQPPHRDPPLRAPLRRPPPGRRPGPGPTAGGGVAARRALVVSTTASERVRTGAPTLVGLRRPNVKPTRVVSETGRPFISLNVQHSIQVERGVGFKPTKVGAPAARAGWTSAPASFAKRLECGAFRRSLNPRSVAFERQTARMRRTPG